MQRLIIYNRCEVIIMKDRFLTWMPMNKKAFNKTIKQQFTKLDI